MTPRPETEETAPGFVPSDDAFRALIRSMGMLRRVMEPYFTRFGISGAQWGVLRTLHRGELQGRKDLRLTDLGERLLVRPPSVTRIVDRLQRMGLVRRSAAPADQRSKHVSLTPAGRRLLRRVLKEHGGQIGMVLEVLSPAEREHLRRLLDRVTAHLQRVVERDGAA